MKIGILTHMVHYGVGGVLQNFALQTALRQLGHDPITLRASLFPQGLSRGFKQSRLYWFLSFPIKKMKGISPTFTEEQYKLICRDTEKFIRENVKITELNYSSADFRESAEKLNCEALIVGSDQIWRSKFAYVNDCFLEFAQDLNVKKIAYAASFAIDYWEFTPEQTKLFSSLAKKFDGISVREDSGVKLCKNNLGVNAELVLDPTFLLDKEQYMDTVESVKEPHYGGKLLSYILDKTPLKEAVLAVVKEKTGYEIISGMPKFGLSYDNIKRYPEDCIYPSITKWLRVLDDSEIVVTDSFHGTALSIIFNKPFFLVVNKNRGAERFFSLLRMFGLEDRMVSNIDEINVNKAIDWNSVNLKRNQMRQKSLSFLAEHLK